MKASLARDFDQLEDLAESVDYAVVGPHDNRVHEVRTRIFPFNTICHLERDFGDGIWRGCTATLISPLKVLSAGHCLYNHRLRRAPVRIRVNPGQSDRDTKPFGSIMTRRFYVPERYVRATNPLHPDRRDFDYGLIVLPSPFNGIRRFMALKALPDGELRRLKSRGLITIAGYPADRPIGTLWRHTERLRRILPKRLYYTVDT
jgi:V8-like Glu-specific endopeptidase